MIYINKVSTFLTGKTPRPDKDFKIGVTKHIQPSEA